MKFSKIEIRDLFFAWILISLAFTILFAGNKILNSIEFFTITFFISGFTVGIGFVLHELMHKIIAQKYGLWAEFRAFYPMLFIAIIFSFIGFIFAAPGAVILKGKINKVREGKISLAGPLTNLILAILFLIPVLFYSFEGYLKLFFIYGLTINSLLAFFNLLPLSFFDGIKIFNWNKLIYFIILLSSILLYILSYFI